MSDANSERLAEIRTRRKRGATARATDVDYLLGILDEIRDIALHPGFATRSGEPLEALDVIAGLLGEKPDA